MAKIVDANEGDEYSISDPDLAGHFKFVRTNGDGSIVLRDRETGKERVVSYASFTIMRGLGVAIRTVRKGVPTYTDALGSYHLLDADDKEIGKKERQRRLAAAKKIVRARTILYFLKQYDAAPDVTTYGPKLGRFLDQTARRAWDEYRFEWRISESQFRIFLNYFGEPGNRTLGQILATSGKHRVSRWPDWMDELKSKMIELYWSARSVTVDTARNFYITKFEEERKRRGLTLIKPPAPETLNGWMRESETQDRYAKKYGSRNAHKRHVGTVDSIKASKPLEYVVLDQTQVDLSLQVTNSKGVVVGTMRAYLVYALDVYSGMVLGFFLTFEPPSVYSLMKCIRHVLRPKAELEERFGLYKGATDGWGKPAVLILDNGLENIGVSLQTVMEGVGIDIEYAALRTPEHKTRVERIFGTTNGLWHQLPGGRPGGLDKRKMPDHDVREDAEYTLPQAMRKLSEFIVCSYHVERPKGGKAPARKWANGIVEYGRNTVDDVNVLDRKIGQYGRAVLTTSGIKLMGEEYHEQAVTSILIRDMARFAKKREQRAPGQSIVLRVNTFRDPLDCSFLNVLNEGTGQLMRIGIATPCRPRACRSRCQSSFVAMREKRTLHSTPT
ncbi:DDE-type integrase/transposase/recombinase [Rhizobium sp. 007]|uniref:DDE-type integrase/transposase/recombinase n=1 Tax=Rhizobium sp. 007 TaxID=2785056 RepID=UPI00188EEF8C|nr:DDE-type integrase/transposase/recombinase [Rhizobium sp. 007]QPB18547.1 DDE-type integrase/transposase/recombinase [Rhizobium sp. 007]